MADLAQASTWHRQVAALVAAADRAGVAANDLPGVRARLLTQQSRLGQEAARTGGPLPALVPSPSEIATAAASLGDLSDAAVARTVRTMLSTLDAVDAAIGAPALTPAGGPSRPEGPPTSPQWTDNPHAHGTALVERAGRRPALRNAAVYGGFAVTVLAVQLWLFLVLDESTSLPLSAPLCLLVLPAFSWLGGFITIGLLFRSGPGEPPVRRTPRLGAVICALPDLVLCAGVVALFIADRVK